MTILTGKTMIKQCGSRATLVSNSNGEGITTLLCHVGALQCYSVHAVCFCFLFLLTSRLVTVFVYFAFSVVVLLFLVF